MKKLFEDIGVQHFAFIAVIAGAFLVGGVADIPATNNAPAPQPDTQESVAWNGEVTAKQYNADGEVIYTHHGENLLTNEGANFIRSHLIGETDNPINYVALSNASSYSTDVNHGYLEGEVTQYNMSRKQGEITTTDTGTWEISVTWVADGSIDGVKATGLFPHDVQGSTDSDTNILVAEETMNPKAFREDYKFELTWEIEQVAG